MFYHILYFLITTGAISISKALMVNQTLLELNMKLNNIGDDGVTAIAKSLNTSSISLLNVNGCGISFAGASSLAEALLSNHKIKALRLKQNPITIDGACLIMKSAMNNAVCKDVKIDSKCRNDEINKMISTLQLDDSSRQDVRN